MAVEYDILLTAVGNDFNLAHNHVFTGICAAGAFHARGECELEFADALRCRAGEGGEHPTGDQGR